MTDHPAAPLLAADLGRLPHTNKRGEQGIIQIPGFATTAGMSQDQAGEAGLLALAIAEGVLEDLEDRHGYRVIAKTDLDAQLRAARTEQARPDELVLYCSRCHNRVLAVDTRSDAPKLHVQIAAQALAAHVEQCR